MATNRGPEDSDGLFEFLRLALSTQELGLIALLAAGGGYFFFQEYGAVLFVLPVIVSVVITIELGTLYGDYLILRRRSRESESLDAAAEISPFSPKLRVQNGWIVLFGIVELVGGWLILLSTFAVAPSGRQTLDPFSQYLLLELRLLARAGLALAIISAGAHFIIARTTFSTSENVRN